MRYYLAPLFATLVTVLGAALPETAQNKSLEGFGHYATFTDTVSGYTFDLHAKNYSGPPSAIMINSSEFVPKTKFRVSDNTYLADVEERDICDKVAVCLGQAADTAATASLFIASTVGSRCNSIAAAISNYFTANNYANLNSVIQGAVVSLVVNIVSTPIGNAMLNSEHAVGDVSTNDDACGVTNKAVLADDFAGAVGQFCQAIQKAKSTNQETHYYAGDVANSGSTTDKGAMSITKAFVAAQAGTFGPACAALGITWKRWLGLSM